MKARRVQKAKFGRSPEALSAHNAFNHLRRHEGLSSVSLVGSDVGKLVRDSKITKAHIRQKDHTAGGAKHGVGAPRVWGQGRGPQGPFITHYFDQVWMLVRSLYLLCPWTLRV